MSFAIIFSRGSSGIEAPLVTIEVHISSGLPSLAIVGLPEKAVKESKDRVRSALMNSNFEFPARRITVNLAPADLPKKEGGRFDLPIALGILAASQQISATSLQQFEFAGELGLDGSLRPFNGALPFAMAARETARMLIVPEENASEAALARIPIFSANHLLDVCAYFSGKKELTQHAGNLNYQIPKLNLDMADIYGQEHAKRALIIAAAGSHSLLMVGPPGTGKTMLASRLNSILPPLSDDEAMEITAIKSVSGQPFTLDSWRQRPFRAPHHTASSVALVGGSSPPRPGEISLAHKGVLFLDELPEFSRHVLEALREPLESGSIIISRAAHQVRFPAQFQFVAAMNPCPCGNLGNKQVLCDCSAEQIKRYQARISGPLLDRIDMYVEVPALPKKLLLRQTCKSTPSAIFLKQVEAAQKLQMERCGKANANLNNDEIMKFCRLESAEQKFLEESLEKLNLSARAYYRLLKVARTIADIDTDLEGTTNITLKAITEALGYRR